MAITLKEILMGRAEYKDLSQECQANVMDLLEAVNKIRTAYGKPMTVSSGYRPAAANAAAGGSSKSSHMTCQAVDFADPKGDLRKWVLENLQLFKDAGVFLEDMRWTPTWVHMQIRKASKRIFIPYADQKKNPMTAPKSWSGSYDSKFD